MTTPPTPHEGTPANRPDPEAPTVEGPAVPAQPDAEPAAHSTEAPAGASAPQAGTPVTGAGAPGPGAPAPRTSSAFRQRFTGWARTRTGVGVLVAAAMFLFVVLPCALASFAVGHVTGGGDDRGGYSREFGERQGGPRGDVGRGHRGPGDGRPDRGVVPPNAPNSPGTATPSPTASATASG